MSQRFLGWFMLVALGILPALVFSYFTVQRMRGWVDSESGGRFRSLTLLMASLTLLSCANICTAAILLQLAPSTTLLLFVVGFVCAVTGLITSLIFIVMWLLPKFQTRQR
jgi:hypothetical protein